MIGAYARPMAAFFWGVFLLQAAAGIAAAHPLGNFTINHLAVIRTAQRSVAVHYVLDIAEIPTFQIMHAQGPWDAARIRQWQGAEATIVASNLVIRASGTALPLRLVSSSTSTRPGAGGLPTLYWTGDYVAPLPASAAVTVHDFVYADRRIGWKDIVLPGLSDPTDALRRYPSALIGSPRRNDVASFNVRDGRVSGVRVTGDAAMSWSAPSILRTSALADLFSRDVQTPWLVLLTVLAAFGLGALHGLEPGHGKALLAFTLVGARATFKQAAVLAAALTFAHTFAVLVLGVLLFVAAGFATEQLFTWITLVSGVVVVAIGARSLAVAVGHAMHHVHHRHDHDGGHEHAHAIPGSSPLHFGSAILAVMSGGIAPCPAAIVVLLAALHLHRIGYGVVLIVIFSLGLAGILTALGMAVVRGSGWLSRQSSFARLAHVAPFATAIVISIIGGVLLAQGIAEQGLALPAPLVVTLALLCVAVSASFPAFLSQRSAHRTLAIKEPL